MTLSHCEGLGPGPARAQAQGPNRPLGNPKDQNVEEKKNDTVIFRNKKTKILTGMGVRRGRFQRPLSIVVVEIDFDDRASNREMVRGRGGAGAPPG